MSEPILNIVLVNPQIPQNTGSIARTVAAIGARLHIVGPTPFTIDEKRVKRAGLDYWPYVDIHIYENIDKFYAQHEVVKSLFNSKSLDTSYLPQAYALTSFGKTIYHKASFEKGCFIVFGSESSGLPKSWLSETHDTRMLTIPMTCDKVRSLNLSNAVSVCAFEALRQISSYSDNFVPRHW